MATRLRPVQYRAINRAVTPRFDRWAKHNYGISGKKLLAKLAAGEGTGVSSAGARHSFQFIGSTRQDFIRRFGIDPWKSPYHGARAAVIHLMGKGGAYGGGLHGYNPGGGQGYVNYILGQNVDTGPLKTGRYGSGGRARQGRGGETRVTGGELKGKLVTKPGVSHAAEREQLKQQYLLGAHGKMPSQKSLLSLASGLSELQDEPATQSYKLSVSPTRVRGGGRARTGRDGIPRGKSPGGLATFEGVKVAAWIKPYLVYGRRHGWKGKVTSGYRSYADQTRIYNSGVRPAARPGHSNHEGANFPRGAVDVTDAATLNRILRRRGTKKLRWAGSKDPPHFSHPHGGGY